MDKVRYGVIGIGNMGTTHARYLSRGDIKGAELTAPGAEGINGLSLSNAMHMSAWKAETVEVGTGEEEFYELLKKRIVESSFKKGSTTNSVSDLSGTYGS